MTFEPFHRIGQHVEFVTDGETLYGSIERMTLDTHTGKYWCVIRDERGMLHDVHEDSVTGIVMKDKG